MPNTDYETQIETFLRECRTASLATVDEHGQPHAANLQFAFDTRWRLFFVSSSRSAHSLHIARQPRAAMTIYGHNDDAAKIHGLQLHVNCVAVARGKAWDHALAVYSARYPMVMQSAAWRELVEKQQFYAANAVWMRWIDNRVRFGFKVEFDLLGRVN